MLSNATRRAAVIGSGPAGLTCALYLSRAGLEPLVFGGYNSGGQLMLTSDVENFPGYPKGVAGPQLMADLREQAERFGAEVLDIDCSRIERGPADFELFYEDKSLRAAAVILATGAEAQWLHAANEERFKGRGISTCATCDAFFFRGKTVAVVGGGDSACEEALYLTKFAEHVHMVVRRDAFRASKVMQQRCLDHDRISVHWNRRVRAWNGRDDDAEVLGSAVLESSAGEGDVKLLIDGAFLAIGHKPIVGFLEGTPVAMDDEGYVITEQDGLFDRPLTAPTMTSIPGIFACGDLSDKRYRQAITAAGSGCAAALDAERWLSGH